MKRKQTIIFTLLLSAFLLLCSFKASLFNYYITDSLSVYKFDVKFTVFLNILFMTSFLYLLVLRFPHRWLFAVVYLGQVLFLLVNLIYYFYFEGYLHFNQYFELWAETLELMKHSAVPFEPRVLIVFLDIPFFILLLIYYKKYLFIRKTPHYRFGCYIPAIFAAWNFSKWDWAVDGTPIQTMSDQYISEVETIKKFGLLTVNLYHVFYIRSYQDLIQQFDYGQKIQKTIDMVDSCKPYNNIVIIQIESMDAFIINKSCHNHKIAPNLYAMSRKYVYYPFMLSYHKAGSTSDCEFSCLNSVEALDKFPSIKLRNYDFPNSLPKRFIKDKYSVAIFHGNRGEYFNRRIAFKKMGFPAFYDINDMRLKEVVWGAPDGEVLKKVNNTILKSSNPFYYHIITMSSHEPFTFTKPYYTTKKFNTISDPIVKNYFTCISYVDSVVARFVRDVRHEQPNTCFFILGDHTPGIKNNKTFVQAAYKEDGLYFEYVPLIIITPDLQRHFEKEKAVSFLDIAPTALEASLAPYSISSLGNNLLKPDSLGNTIPYRGKKFTRKELFNKINSLYKQNYKTRIR